MVDLKGQYKTIEEPVLEAVHRALSEAAYINGPDVKAFEKEFAAFLGVSHAIPCANGTDALHIAFRALGIGPGDEVITTAFTFVATAGTISLTGATPVFVDIDPETFNIDPAAIEAAITPRTKAIAPVHLFGSPADMDPIMEIARKHNLAVVEDCAQSTGATYKGRMTGTIGTIGCFSFFPSKNLGCFGDGGMVVTNDPAVAERLRPIGAHGSRVKYYNDVLGFNSRLDTLQAAILRVKLPHLAEWNQGRRAAAAMYAEALAGTGVVVPADSKTGVHVYHQYTVRHAERDRIMAHLGKVGVACAVYYPVPLHLQGMYKHLGYAEGSLPYTEAAARNVMSLPMYPELTREIVDRVAGAVRDALATVSA